MIEFLRGLAIAVLAACGMFLLFLTLNSTLLVLDTNKIAQTVNAGVVSGAIDNSDVWGQTECMILWMASSGDSPGAKLVLPKIPVFTAERLPHCAALKARAFGHDVASVYYPRYLHGYRVTTAWLLTFFSLATIPVLLVSVACAIPLAGIAYVLANLRHGDRIKLLSHATVNVLFLTSFGIGYYDARVAFAFGDIALLLLWQSFLFVNPASISNRTAAVLYSCFGAVLAYFEFFTGQITLAVPILFLAGGIYLSADREGMRRFALILSAFLSGFSVVILQQGAIALTFGFDRSFLAQLAFYTSPSTALPPMADYQIKWLDRFGLSELAGASSYLRMALQFPFYIHFLGSGSFAVAASIIAASITVLAAELIVARNGDRYRAMYAAGAVVFLAAWYIVFVNHTIQHMTYMARPLVVLPMAAAVLIVYRFVRAPPTARASETALEAKQA